MKRFEHINAKSAADAVSLLEKHGAKAALMAGGSDILGLLKDRIIGPKMELPEILINIKSIPNMNYIKEAAKGLRIGALATLSDIESNKAVREKIPILAQAAHEVGVPQIRNVATIGGNICQRPRCWYFRTAEFTKCYKRGGDFCYAVTGENKYNCVLGGELCFIVHPSDLAPALIALGASVKVIGPKRKERSVALEKFFVGPREDVLRETVLKPGELVSEVQIPYQEPNSRGIYLKSKERKALSFSISSVAAQITVKDGVCKDARLVLAGVAPIPWRVPKAEEVLKGKKVDEKLAAQAGEVSVEGERRLSFNGYKVAMTRAVVKHAILALS